MLTDLFKQSNQIFQSEMCPEDRLSVMCQLHDYFVERKADDHNCLGCNFAEVSTWIAQYLSRFETCSLPDEAFVFYLIRLYLFVERANVIFEIIKLPEEYRSRHFTVFKNINKWANFIKHPNAFLLVHHPVYSFVDDPNFDKTKYTMLIDQQFVNEHYSSPGHNKKLWDALENKKDIAVIFPNPVILTKDFCSAAKKFLSLIRDNEVYREILASRTTYQNYFVSQSETET